MVLDCLFIFWFLFNIVAMLVMAAMCLSNAEFDKLSILLYPLLISELREKLNIAGTIIVTALFSILFLLAITVYFILLGILVVGYFVGTRFIKIFERKD